MYELAGFVWIARSSIGSNDMYFGIRNRLTDRVGSSVDFFRRKIGTAKGLRQAVHQVRPRSREDAAKLREGLAWHSAAGIREVSHSIRRAGWPRLLHQLHPKGRDTSDSGDLIG